MQPPYPAALGRLAEIPRLVLAHSPTPIDALENLGRHLGSDARLTAKRDDCTGLAFGGNKVRQLEFYLGQAAAAKADTVLITGAVQSNFVRATAAAARKLGLECHIQLEERVPDVDEIYRSSGNVLLDKVLGARLYRYPEGEDEAGADQRLRSIAERLRREAGKRPFIIPLAPGHPPYGALGYVLAAAELLAQARGAAAPPEGIGPDEIVVASGSGHTHAGLLFGLRALGSRTKVTGVCVRREARAQRQRIAERCAEIAALLEVRSPVEEADIELLDDYLAPGYGRLNAATLEAIRLAAEREGLMVDPVYTGKAMAGFIARARAAGAGSRLMFLHTGGTPAIFAYEPALSRAFL